MNPRMFSSKINSSSVMVKPKLQRQKTISSDGSNVGLFPTPKKSLSLKRKRSDDSLTEVCGDESSTDQIRSAFTPCRPSKRRRTSTCSSDSSDSGSWYSGLWDMVTNTLHECKLGISKVYPISFSMQCEAFLQQEDPSSSRNFALVVLCQRQSSADSGIEDCFDDFADSQQVGGSLKPRNVKPGITFKYFMLII